MARDMAYSDAVVRSTGKARRKKVVPNALAPGEQKVVDGYREKLVKYVPVEATIFFSLAYGKLADKIDGDQRSGRVWWTLTIVTGAFIAVLFAGAGKRERDPYPWYFYALAPLAFLAWAVGTTTIAQEMFPGFLKDANDVVFAGAAFIIPGVDQLLSRRRERAAEGEGA